MKLWLSRLGVAAVVGELGGERVVHTVTTVGSSER